MLAADTTTASKMLQIRQQERDALLTSAVTLLEQDSRIAAAWLFGSLGRGTADALSDLDLFVVVEEEHSQRVIADRYAQMEALGTPLLILEAPQNRPPGGAYNMALYEGQQGPHQVDWYWQPRSLAAIPAQTRLLLDRTRLPRLETPPHFDYQPVPERDLVEVLSQKINFFWVMLLIAAKSVARDPDGTDLGMLSFLLTVYEGVRELMPTGTLPAPLSHSLSPHHAVKMRLLRSLADDVTAMMPVLSAKGLRVPYAVALPAQKYLDLVDALIASPVLT